MKDTPSKQKNINYMKTITSILLAAVIAASNFGCCAFAPRTQTIGVTTNPADAELTINGIHYHSPAQVPVPRDMPVVMMCSKDGFETQQRVINTHLNGLAFLDTVGLIFFLVPGVGLLTPGSHSLDETAISIDLYHPYVPPVIKPVEKIGPRK
jgi:hypothetical protein